MTAATVIKWPLFTVHHPGDFIHVGTESTRSIRMHMICLGVVHFGKFARRSLAKVYAVATLESLMTVGLLPFCRDNGKSLREIFPKARLYLIPMRNSIFQARKDRLGECRHAQHPRISIRRVPWRGAGRRGSGCRCGRVRRNRGSDSLAKISRRPYAAIQSFNSMPGPGDLPGSESDCVTRWELQVTKDGFYPGA
jgi:hypothetical protein